MTEEGTNKRKLDDKLPVTLLGGFLGAGKSTLLKHILETKRADGDDFKCAVIVNDMAELNIDQSLIASSGLIHSDEVVSMQNGCVCCSLSGELVDRIVELSQRREPKLDYIIIESSGVTEPAAVAALFGETCDKKEGETKLGDVARLDTLATVVDSAHFLENIDAIRSSSDGGEKKGQTSSLLVDQVEHANVVLLNKTDLVNEDQLEKIKEHVAALNGGAKILTCKNSEIDVKDVISTGLYDAKHFDLGSFMERFGREEKPKSCCKAAIDKGESPCCLRKRTISSKLSQVLLPSGKNGKTRHGEIYGISSFVYKARRPFSPSEFHEKFLDKFFTVLEEDDDDDEDDEDEDAFAMALALEAGDEEEKSDEMDSGDDGKDAISDDENEEDKESKKIEAIAGDLEKAAKEAKEEAVKMLQEEAAEKKVVRAEAMGGTLLRVKGFMWMGSSHDLITSLNIAGNVARMDSPGPWNVLDMKAWKGTEEEKKVIRKNFVDPWGDRRQELVFIGKDIKHEEIQKVLDSCLCDDETMAIGVDGWKATFGDMFLDSN